MPMNRTICRHALWIAGLSTLIAASPLHAATYDAANDFSPSANPNGVWSYGYSDTLGSPLILYGTHGLQPNPGGSPTALDSWYTNISLFDPYVAHNGTSATVGLAGTAVFAPGQLGLHPGPAGQYSIVQFTAPTTGVYTLSTAFSGLDFVGPTTTDVHVLLNGTSLFDGNVNNFGAGPTFSDVLSLKSGDRVDFEVGNGSDHTFLFDSTGLSATLTTTTTTSAAPEPSSLVLVAVGATILGGCRIRRPR